MAKELELIPALKEGEVLLISRSLGGKNVVMVVTIAETDDGNFLSKDEISFTARMDTWGVTPYADAQIGRQRESIDRLLRHLQVHCVDPLCEFRDLTKSPCRRTDAHEPHVWFNHIRLGIPGSTPGSEQAREIESHCPGYNPLV